MFCPYCGAPNPDDNRFCSQCGRPLPTQDPAPADDVEEVPQKPQSTPDAAGKSSQQPQISSGTASSKGHREINPLLIAAAAAVAIVALVVFLTGGFNFDNPSVQASVNDYSWEELQEISDKIAKASSDDEGLKIAEKYRLCTDDGKLDGTQTKDVTLTDGAQTSVQIAGFRHDDKSDGSGKAGIAFIFKDAISYQKMNQGASNSGGWESSQMRQWLANDGMSLMPDDLRSAIVSVKKLTNNMGASKLESAVTETDDSLWLLSYNEVSGNYHEWNLDIGVRYG